MTREERLMEKGWEILAYHGDESVGDESFIALDPHGFISIVYFYENGDGERCVDQYFENTLEVIESSYEDSDNGFFKGFDFVNGAPDWYGLEKDWWEL